MKQRCEQTAKYRITEELNYRGEKTFYVYVRKQTYNHGVMFYSVGWEWKKIDSFDTQEKAEKYVEAELKYEESKENPKIIGYY